MPDQDEEKTIRSEYRVVKGDTLASLLERIRETQGTELLLDITENNLLLKDGSLRRTLVSAASEFDKKIYFSFSENNNMRKPEHSEENKRSLVRVGQKIKEKKGLTHAVPIALTTSEHGKGAGFGELPKIKLSDSGKRIAVFFSFFAGILLAGGIFFILPSAEINITPEVEPVSMNVKIVATVSALNIDTEKMLVPAQILNYEESANGVFPVRGISQQGEKARGEVTIVNKTATEQKIKSKSRLGGSGEIVFIMDESVVVAPHGSARVRITADQGGTAGNLKDGKLYFLALPDTDRSILFAEVSVPLEGGTDKTVPALSKDDIENAKRQFLSEKQDKIKQTLSDSLTDDVIRDDIFMQIDLSDISSVELEGAQITEFHLKGKAKSKYFVFKLSDVNELIKMLVSNRVNDGKVLSKPLSGTSLKVNEIDWKQGAVGMNYSLQNSTQSEVDLDDMRKNLISRTSDGAVTYLEGLPGIKDVSVKLSPFWVKRVPGFKRNINIEITVP